MSKKPDSSRKTRWAPRLSAFFYMGPMVPLPMSDLFLVSLQSSSLGLLTTPSQAYEELPHVAGMILNVELLVDHFGYPV
jgi:hypothetical protein